MVSMTLKFSGKPALPARETHQTRVDVDALAPKVSENSRAHQPRIYGTRTVVQRCGASQVRFQISETPWSQSSHWSGNTFAA